MSQSRKPRIGIACGYDDEHRRFYVNEGYIRAVEMAGGMPMLLPAPRERREVAQQLEMIDGLLLPGGYDLDPKWWGEELGPHCGKVVPVCDETEIALCQRALVEHVPVLGICRGVQTLNVAAGGTLYQDLPSQNPSDVAHTQRAPTWYPTHAVRVAADSVLGTCMLSETRVNSFHHQAVRDVGPGLRAVAWASDGVVEAIEGTGPGFALGVQWHPELMFERNPVYGQVFRLFVEACVPGGARLAAQGADAS